MAYEALHVTESLLTLSCNLTNTWRLAADGGTSQMSCSIDVIRGRAYVYESSCTTLKTINTKYLRMILHAHTEPVGLPIRYLPIATEFSLCYSSLSIDFHCISLHQPEHGRSLTIPLSSTKFCANPTWTTVAMSGTRHSGVADSGQWNLIQ